jgi:S1-C subfamily serine protease
MPPTREFGVMAIGTRINTVVAGSSAARVGLRRGDLVMSVDGAPLPAGEDFDQALTRRCRSSMPISISVLCDAPRSS